jgi:biopolymer transport protein ExbD
MTRKREVSPVGFELPITPMLDFTFQLLFFFMLYYNPSNLEGQMDMSLPAPAEAQAPANTTPTEMNQNDVPELPADLTVVLKTQNDGTNNGIISQISVKDRSGETTVPNLEALRKHLEEARQGLSNKEDITIEPDSRLKWFAVVQVMDVCKKAGFRIGFGAPPDLGVTAQ